MRKFLDLGTAAIAATVGALHTLFWLEDGWALLALFALYVFTVRNSFRRTQVLLGSFVGTAPLGLTVPELLVPSPPFWVWALFLYWIFNLVGFRNISIVRGFLAGGAVAAFLLLYLFGILLPTLRGDSPGVTGWPPVLATATFIGTLWFSKRDSAGCVAFLAPMIALAYLLIGLNFFLSLLGLGNTTRLDLFYNSPNVFGSFLLIIVALAWRNTMAVKGLRSTLVHNCVLFLGIYSTGSRSAFLGLVFLFMGFLMVGLARRFSKSPHPIKLKLSKPEVHFLLTAGAGFGTSAAAWATSLLTKQRWGLEYNDFIVWPGGEADPTNSLNQNVRLSLWESALSGVALWGQGFPDGGSIQNSLLFLINGLGIIPLFGVISAVVLSAGWFYRRLGQRVKTLDLVVAGTIMVPLLFHDEVFFPAPYFMAGFFLSSLASGYPGRLKKT